MAVGAITTQWWLGGAGLIGFVGAPAAWHQRSEDRRDESASRAVAPSLAELPEDLSDRRSAGWWGAVGLVATEATLFAALLAGYVYLRIDHETWPFGGIEPPKLVLPALGTGLLVASSAVLVWAERAARDRRGRRAAMLTALTAVLGAGFLLVLALEFQSRAFGVDTNAYGTVVYAITALHGAHVAVGVALLAFVVRRYHRAPDLADRAARPIGLYWHAVGAIWLVIFATLYLSERI
jgi:cytochrome c oxidase subunit 3/cytochrome c oxidase subunit I+III